MLKSRLSQVIIIAATFLGLGIIPSRAADGIRLPGDRFFPEGIAQSEDGTFYVGSLTEGRIVKIAPGSTETTPFIAPGSNGLISVIGLLADDAKQTLWACSSDPGKSQFTGSGPVALKAFDLKTGAAKGSYPFPGKTSFCNDLTLDSQGNVYVTDSLNPRILRLARGSKGLEVWLTDQQFAGEGFGLNGIAFDDGNLFVVKSNSSELFRISINVDGTSGKVQKISVPGLGRPDGFKRISPNTFVVVEGGNLSQIKVNGNQGELKILAKDLNQPTTVVVNKNIAWVVEGQLGILFDPKQADRKPNPFQVKSIDLEN